MVQEMIGDWMLGNPKTVYALMFVIGWMMKRAPWFEKLVKGVTGWYAGIKK
jgi:hypothetical protein